MQNCILTSDATNKSAMANDAKNKFPIRRKLRSVYIAKHTKIFPAMDKNIKRDRKMPVTRKTKKSRERKQTEKILEKNKSPLEFFENNSKILCRYNYVHTALFFNKHTHTLQSNANIQRKINAIFQIST